VAACVYAFSHTEEREREREGFIKFYFFHFVLFILFLEKKLRNWLLPPNNGAMKGN